MRLAMVIRDSAIVQRVSRRWLMNPPVMSCRRDRRSIYTCLVLEADDDHCGDAVLDLRITAHILMKH